MKNYNISLLAGDGTGPEVVTEAVKILGGFITGLAGFGTALFALGWWLVVLPPKDAVTVVIILAISG